MTSLSLLAERVPGMKLDSCVSCGLKAVFVPESTVLGDVDTNVGGGRGEFFFILLFLQFKAYFLLITWIMIAINLIMKVFKN